MSLLLLDWSTIAGTTTMYIGGAGRVPGRRGSAATSRPSRRLPPDAKQAISRKWEQNNALGNMLDLHVYVETCQRNFFQKILL